MAYNEGTSVIAAQEVRGLDQKPATGFDGKAGGSRGPGGMDCVARRIGAWHRKLMRITR